MQTNLSHLSGCERLVGLSVLELRVPADRRRGRRHQRQSAYHGFTSLSDGGDTCANPHVKEYPVRRLFAFFAFFKCT